MAIGSESERTYLYSRQRRLIAGDQRRLLPLLQKGNRHARVYARLSH